MLWLESFISRFDSEERAILCLTAICALLVAFLVLLRLGEIFFAAARMGRQRKRLRRQQRMEEKRALRYTLPDRENSYVRARLHTALQPQTTDGEEPIELRLGYVRKMLAKVKEAALSPVERLDVEELSSLIALYVGKEKWSTEDRKAVNEVFARLLKLSAKYKIAV